ncbi:MAG: hypothetical protein HY820_37010 [Acidobacteria bacterium]|nr:hypothetical protein [Acidobacteriota bacterium]
MNAIVAGSGVLWLDSLTTTRGRGDRAATLLLADMVFSPFDGCMDTPVVW